MIMVPPCEPPYSGGNGQRWLEVFLSALWAAQNDGVQLKSAYVITCLMAHSDSFGFDRCDYLHARTTLAWCHDQMIIGEISVRNNHHLLRVI
jgi:hypothetical protein